MQNQKAARLVTLSVGEMSEAAGREWNQDSVGSWDDYGIPRQLAEQRGLLYVVCDGMGGQYGGKVASSRGVQQVIHEYYTRPWRSAQAVLARAIEVANAAIYEEASRTPGQSGMGTTFVGALMMGSNVLIANVGDSRAYLIRSGHVRQVTSDHTWVAEALARRGISREEARNHLMRHVITRSMGASPDVRPDFFTETLQFGDTIVLCSDDVTNVVTDADMAATVTGLSARQAAERLVQVAKQLRTNDNATALVLRFGGDAKGAG